MEKEEGGKWEVGMRKWELGSGKIRRREDEKVGIRPGTSPSVVSSGSNDSAEKATKARSDTIIISDFPPVRRPRPSGPEAEFKRFQHSS